MENVLAIDDGLGPLVQRAFDGVALVAPNPWRLVYANPSLLNWLATSADDISGRSLNEVFGADWQAALMEGMESAWPGNANDDDFHVDLSIGDRNLCRIDVRICRVVMDDTPLIGLLLHQLADTAQPAAIQLDRRDPLTGLLDRDFLMARLAVLLRGERTADQQFAVLFIDLDNFKLINDEYGHLLGDTVLREAARRLDQCVREGDHVVRYGGDEFVVLLEQVGGAIDVEPVISRIQTAIAQPIAIPKGEVTLSVSVGVAFASPEYRTAEELLSAADRAMYAAKAIQLP